MVDRENIPEMPRCLSSLASLSSGKKQRKMDSQDEDTTKRKKGSLEYPSGQLGNMHASAQPDTGLSHVNSAADRVLRADSLDHLSGLLNGEILKCLPDPLDELDKLTAAQPNCTSGDDTDFLKALEDLSGHFQGEEEKGEPLFECLAAILNSSLRHCPSFGAVKATCGKMKIPRNVPNLKLPTTNTAITKAFSLGSKFIDVGLLHTNGLIAKALVPIACCINDIGEKKGQNINCHLDGLNNSLRLLSSTVHYVNHLRKEVARIHVHDSALPDLCRWECEVGQDDLFLFDMVKKCEEAHRKEAREAFYPFLEGTTWLAVCPD
ncbi:hypothetical protein E2C01_042586 [Portunus trituberculatus]|uniref:Uncharacterized protein n=1 Tax=Portunus trituberculatus TaxID=210409 RepID=A0A5B7FV28_PORTR|nr:hypothetical protein [Portunus trituberculatus]